MNPPNLDKKIELYFNGWPKLAAPDQLTALMELHGKDKFNAVFVPTDIPREQHRRVWETLKNKFGLNSAYAKENHRCIAPYEEWMVNVWQDQSTPSPDDIRPDLKRVLGVFFDPADAGPVLEALGNAGYRFEKKYE